MSATTEAVLISWVSINHGAAPLIPAIRDPKSVLGARVRRIYLCSRKATSPDGQREQDALDETVKVLNKELRPHCPEIVQQPWVTAAAPTDHAEIRKFAETVLTRVRRENPGSLLVIHLSPGTPAMHAVWLALGTTGFVPGPIKLIQTADNRGLASGKEPVQVVNFRLDTILQRYHRTRPHHSSGDDDGQIWNPANVKSKALNEALGKLQRWAPLRVPVLLVGERGTGKTTLANYLRAISPFQKDAAKGWPAVVCGQFRTNPQLARSELFGHAQGAFTGAVKEHRGILELADGDTVFFDEIADIDRDTQRLLIAAVESRGFRRLGDTTLQQPSFRLVCATNRTLVELRRECLDPDFYDRIAVFVLDVPPLRECKEDIPDAWAQVLARATMTADIRPEGWQRFTSHPGLLEHIHNHPLPGNFRDLQRAAFHVLAELQAGSSETVVAQTAIRALDECPGGNDVSPSLEPHFPVNFEAHISDYRRQWFDAALRQSGGNKAEAARLLGMPRKTLDHHLKHPTGRATPAASPEADDANH